MPSGQPQTFSASPSIQQKKTQTKIGRELFNQGASTNLVSRLTAPLSGHFGRIWENLWRGRAIAKKNPAKIGRELFNQGASTNLVSGSRCTCSGQFAKILENWRFGVRSQKKTGQNWSGVN
ncbi:hypothetical protein QUA27_18915 [Microcoleus sp. Pol14C6]|uniref:hypothetical protein n=1 Tax=unclassified Microcoleus TaxID=2642155 RepID=UPI002FD3EED4